MEVVRVQICCPHHDSALPTVGTSIKFDCGGDPSDYWMRWSLIKKPPTRFGFRQTDANCYDDHYICRFMDPGDISKRCICLPHCHSPLWTKEDGRSCWFGPCNRMVVHKRHRQASTKFASSLISILENTMTLVSYDPSWWPSIYSYRISSYFVVAGSAGVMYDWVLTFGQEVELVWRQPWSLFTVLYLSVRYLGISYAIINMLIWVPTISMTDAGCFILNFAENWIGVVVYAALGVILIARLHAMYQRSRKVLIFLIVILLAVNIFDGVVVAISVRKNSWEELVLSGTSQCTVGFDDIFLHSMTWIFTAVWEVLALIFAVWVAVKHFYELRQHSAGGLIKDSFTVLMKTHMVYFTSVVIVSCFDLSYFFSTMPGDTTALGTQIYFGLLDIFQLVRMFVLGPRLILGVREYKAKLVAGSHAITGMTSIAFEERVHVSTSSSV